MMLLTGRLCGRMLAFKTAIARALADGKRIIFHGVANRSPEVLGLPGKWEEITKEYGPGVAPDFRAWESVSEKWKEQMKRVHDERERYTMGKWLAWEVLVKGGE